MGEDGREWRTVVLTIRGDSPLIVPSRRVLRDMACVLRGCPVAIGPRSGASCIRFVCKGDHD